MPRIARVVAPGLPHHVTQQGNRGMKVFVEPSCWRKYLAMLADYAGRYGLAIWAYCLTEARVSFVAVPNSGEALGRTFRDTHQAYAAWLNRKTGETGHLWQSRFASCPLDEPHLAVAVRYVERTPIREALSAAAEDWPWSSAAAHCGLRSDPLLAPGWPVLIDRKWASWLAAEDDPLAVARLVRRTRTGRPCGSDEFIEHLESTLNRRLALQKPGPKPRAKPGPEPSPQASNTRSPDWQFWGENPG